MWKNPEKQMIDTFVRCCLALSFVVLPLAVVAQGGEQQPSSPQQEQLEQVVSAVEVKSRMNQFIDELKELHKSSSVAAEVDSHLPVSASLISSYSNRIRLLEQSLRFVLSRWDTYFVAQQYEIAASEELMTLVADLNQLKQAVSDSIDVRKQECNALNEFRDAENLLQEQEEPYRKLYKKAIALSQVSKTAPLLEKLKAKEAMTFADIQASYDKAKAAVLLVPELNNRLENLEEDYINLKTASEKIQAMEYQPFFIRIKDYLLGMAAVAILLLFVNLAMMRIQSLKKAHAAMKQYKNMMKTGNGEGYPTI